MPDAGASPIRAVLGFVVLTVACAALIATVAGVTRERIEDNRSRQFLQTLSELTGSTVAAAEVAWTDDVALLCPDAALLRGAAPGYGGDIHWIAAIDLSAAAPTVTKVRITAHRETPGIADFLDRPESGWLASLHGQTAPELGDVAAVTGATITTRAVTRALLEALQRPALDRGCEP